MKKIDLVGQTFGEWTVLHRVAGSIWMCACSCGNTSSISSSSFKAGHSTKCRSCGTKTHGKARTKIHGIWNSMMMRCGNPNHVHFSRYGGRGIKVCESWKTFSNFFADMGDRPEGKTLDRIDNNGDYTPENVRWADSKQQNRNRSNNSLHTVGDKTATIAEWAEIKGMPARQLRDKMIRNGLTMAEALDLPYSPLDGKAKRATANRR